MDEMRKIIHVDMDAFFAAVEQRDNPGLRGKPIAVGHDGPRGVVATASYEARVFGVHSAQPVAVARRRCPELIVINGRHGRYKEISAGIHEIFHDYTDLVEPISLDEAFLDVTHNKKGMDLAVDIAREIKRRIYEKFGLTASAGVASNKLLAKIASDLRKPDGLCTIHPSQALRFLDPLPVERIWGVGPKTAERLHAMGIFTVPDLRARSLQELQTVFGKAGAAYYAFSRGEDNRPVETERVRKSVGCEQTFLFDLIHREELINELEGLTRQLVTRLERSRFEGRTLTLKVKYADFTQTTHSATPGGNLIPTEDALRPIVLRLLDETDCADKRPVRLLGLTVSNPLLPEMPKRSEWIQLKLDFKD